MKPLTAIAKRSLQATLAALLTLALSSFGATMAHAEDATTTISGSVTLNGEPAAGLEVCAYVPVVVDDGYVNAADPCVFTDGTGLYQFGFALPEATDNASVWVKPGIGDKFPQTTYGTSLRDPNGYFTVVPGQTRVLDAISLVAPVAEIASATPTIAGKVKVGKRLAAKAGKWGPAGVRLSYQWLRNGKTIARATGDTYKLTKADRGKKIKVMVTGRADGCDSVTSVSKATKKVAKR